MGITVHWRLKFEGDKEQVLNRFKFIKNGVSMLPIKDIQGPWNLDFKTTFEDDAENAKQVPAKHVEAYRWAKIQASPPMVEEGDRISYPKNMPNFYGYVLHIWQGLGCEPTNLSLITCDGRNWIGHGFTKTQYARNFVKAHLTICGILDMVKETGMLDYVGDEAEYYETRNLEVLGKNINESTAMIAGLAKALKKTFGEGNLVSEIDNCKNFVKVKKGRF